MKNRIREVRLYLICAALMLAGIATANAEDTSVLAEQAYIDFLNGKTSVITAEAFGKDDAQGNFDGLFYGTYSYETLKSAVAELEGGESITQYTFLYSDESITKLVVRLKNVTPGFMNWNGIIAYHDGGLELTYAYEDGGRSSSTLYTNGILLTGGPVGAGGYSNTVLKIGEDGFSRKLYISQKMYGTFASSIAYALTRDGTGLSEDYADISGESNMLVRAYITNDSAKLSVSGFSEDSAIRFREEALIGELERFGAVRVSGEEMDALCSLAPYETEEAEWLEWNTCAALSVRYAGEELDEADDIECFIADDSEYRVDVAFTANRSLMNFRVLSLWIEEVSDGGSITFGTEELYALEALEPERPLVVGMAFWGEIPNMGIAYVDESGTERIFAISMSGADGELVLTEVNVNR